MIRDIAKSIYHFWLFRLVWQGIALAFRKYVIFPLRTKEYERLKGFQNKHKGERCFIIATAPSLTLDDVEKIKGEITFSMNTSYRLFDKTSWRPTYYCIEDESVYHKIKDDLNHKDFNQIILSDYIKWKGPNIFHVPVLLNWAGTHAERKHLPKKYQTKKFSDDITKICYFGSSVVHFIMQLCFYMGFKEIYLIGVDCDFSQANNHSKYTSYKGAELKSNPPKDVQEGLFGDYELAKKEAGIRGIKIYNATRGGKLEVFPRVNIDELEFLK